MKDDDGGMNMRRTRRLFLWISVVVGGLLLVAVTALALGMFLMTISLVTISDSYDFLFFTGLPSELTVLVGGIAGLLLLLGGAWGIQRDARRETPPGSSRREDLQEPSELAADDA